MIPQLVAGAILVCMQSDFLGTSLQVPPAYLLQRTPLHLEGEVVAGFGRGSAKMGVPTANIAPGPLAEKLQALPLGVYFGCAPALAPISCLNKFHQIFLSSELSRFRTKGYLYKAGTLLVSSRASCSSKVRHALGVEAVESFCRGGL